MVGCLEGLVLWLVRVCWIGEWRSWKGGEGGAYCRFMEIVLWLRTGLFISVYHLRFGKGGIVFSGLELEFRDDWKRMSCCLYSML